MIFSVKSLIFVFCSLCSSFLVYNVSHAVNSIIDFKTNESVYKNDIVDEGYNDITKNEVLDVKSSEHIMTLSIPKININNKIYSKESIENDIDKNVQLMAESDMPDYLNGNVILGGHSGTGRLAYFKDLNKLVIGDLISLNYNGVDYLYRVVNYYIDDKDGSIVISRDLSKNSITLFTCMPNDKNNYLVIIGELV